MATKHQKTIHINEAVELFLLDCKSRKLTPSTLIFYQARLFKFVAWCNEQGLTGINQIDATTIKRYQVDMMALDLSSQYLHGLSRALKTFFIFCQRDKLIKLPIKVNMPKLERKVLQAFTADEVKAILNACTRPRDKAIIYTLLDTGVRAAELCALTVGDVDLINGVMTVRRGKGQKGRYVQFGTKVTKAIRTYFLERSDLQPEQPLFPSNKAKDHLRPDGLGQFMDRLKELTGIEHCTAHTFRRTFAITCLRNGMNVHILAKLMGHADIQILRQYLDMVESDLQAAHKLASPADNL